MMGWRRTGRPRRGPSVTCSQPDCGLSSGESPPRPAAGPAAHGPRGRRHQQALPGHKSHPESRLDLVPRPGLDQLDRLLRPASTLGPRVTRGQPGELEPPLTSLLTAVSAAATLLQLPPHPDPAPSWGPDQLACPPARRPPPWRPPRCPRSPASRPSCPSTMTTTSTATASPASPSSCSRCRPSPTTWRWMRTTWSRTR